jgi:hypothetical protein
MDVKSASLNDDGGPRLTGGKGKKEGKEKKGFQAVRLPYFHW